MFRINKPLSIKAREYQKLDDFTFKARNTPGYYLCLLSVIIEALSGC